MTQVQGESIGQGQVLDGTITGRFIYTSEGSAGWRVSTSVGTLPDEVQQEAIGYNQRLTSPQGFATPDPNLRNRRIAWVGSPKSQWRFLMNSIAAGSDASNRPNNCVNDCLVVRRDSRVSGTDPASFWDSPDWSTPYGAQEVSTLDLRRNPSALQPRPSAQAVDVSQLATYLHEGGRPPGYLLGLAALIDRIAYGARSSWVGTQDDVQAMGPILLSSLYRMLPTDIGWEVTSEIWHITDGQVTPTGADVALRFADSNRLPSSLQPLQISDATTWQPRDHALCPDCGQRQWSWADVLTAGLFRLAGLMRAGAPAQEINRLAGQFSGYCQALREHGVTSSNFVQRFTAEALPEQYRDLTSLVGEVVTHDHIRVVMYNSDSVAGTQRLRHEPPSDITHLQALWFRFFDADLAGMAAVPGGWMLGTGTSREEARLTGSDQVVLNMHLALGDGPQHAFDWLRNWCALGSEELRVISDPSVMPGVLNRLLRSVAVVATGHHASGSPPPLQPRHVINALQYADGGDWWEPIASLDLLGQFLQSWTDQLDVSVISPLLKTPASRDGKTFPVGYWMAVEALKPRDAELTGQYLGIIQRQRFGVSPGIQVALDDLSEHVRRSARGPAVGGVRG